MSYTRNYHETITVRGAKTVTVNYPASQNGGSKSVTIDYREDVPVNVNIHVDTKSFDNSVEHCNNHVNLLTGAIVATEAAQIASIDQNAKQVAATIVGGFFGYIRSEISQQITELTGGIDARLMHLRELSLACQSKMKQMESDFNRIAQRYIKIFEDLNRELSNRIKELDKPTFKFKGLMDEHQTRSVGNDMVNTAAVFGREGSELNTRILGGMARKRAQETIHKAAAFISQQQKADATIRSSMITERITCTHYMPVCMIQSTSDDGRRTMAIHMSERLSFTQSTAIKNSLDAALITSSIRWEIILPTERENIWAHLQTLMNSAYPSMDPTSRRVREMILHLAEPATVNVPRSQQV
jgi:hypothetical protein